MNNYNYQNQLDFMDFLNIFSVYLALVNLAENREQSAHNDIESANSKQEKHIMDNLTRLFNEQNEMLKDIQERLEILENRP